jgi:Glycosyltransferase family 87
MRTARRRRAEKQARARLGAYPTLLVTLAFAFGLTLAFAPKLACQEQLRAGLPERHWCFSDLKQLWDARGFDVDAAPYGDPPPGYPVDYQFEYPPGIGLPAYGLARLTATRMQFFLVNAVTLAACAAFALWQLDRALRALGRPGSRLLLFAASPGLMMFAMHTWDLWSVAPAAAGLAAAARGRPRLAGAWFGLGAAVKWWPALLVVLLLVGPWAAGEAGAHGSGRPSRLRQLAPAATAAAVWAAVQIPAIAISPANWWGSTAVHLQRRANRDSLFGVIFESGATLWPSSFWSGAATRLLTLVTLGSLLVGVGYVARRLHRGTLDAGDAAVALVALFLLTAKVFSPQFILWLAAVAVVSRVPWSRLLAVEVPNAAVWIFLAGQLFHLQAFRPLAVLRWMALAWMLATVLTGRPGSTSG